MDDTSSMYENTLASNKVHLMKILFMLRVKEVQHINELNIVINQLSLVGIEFDNEV